MFYVMQHLLNEIVERVMEHTQVNVTATTGTAGIARSVYSFSFCSNHVHVCLPKNSMQHWWNDR
jgi:hypothetical protein